MGITFPAAIGGIMFAFTFLDKLCSVTFHTQARYSILQLIIQLIKENLMTDHETRKKSRIS